MAAAVVVAFKALLGIRRRLINNNSSAAHLRYSLQTVKETLGDTPNLGSAPSLQRTLTIAQGKLTAFLEAGWIFRWAPDWKSIFVEQRENVLLALVTHAAAEILAQKAGRSLGTSERPGETKDCVTGPGWIHILRGDITRPDAHETQAFIKVAGLIVENALTTEQARVWVSQLTLENLPVPDLIDGGSQCAVGFVTGLLVEGVDRATCQQLAEAIEGINCPTLLNDIVELLIAHLGRPGRQAACQTLNLLLKPGCAHNDAFMNLLIESLDETVLKSLGELLVVHGDTKLDSLGILERLAEADGGRMKLLLRLGEFEKPATQVFGTFCGMVFEDPSWKQARKIVRRLGSIRVSRGLCGKDIEVQRARDQIKGTLGRMNGLPMTVLILKTFKYG